MAPTSSQHSNGSVNGQQSEGDGNTLSRKSCTSETTSAIRKMDADISNFKESVMKLTEKVIKTIQELPPDELFATPEQLASHASKTAKYKKKLPEATLEKMREEMRKQDREYFKYDGGSLLPEDF